MRISRLGHVAVLKRDAAYEYLNWYNSGWVGGFIAKQGYYSSNPKTAMAALTENERGFFYEGKPATADITSPTGKKTNSAGDKRDGGSFEDWLSKVAVWNNLMDQAAILSGEWNEFTAARTHRATFGDGGSSRRLHPPRRQAGKRMARKKSMITYVQVAPLTVVL